MARIRAERVCRRRRDTPETPGDAWGPPCSAKRRDGTASPRGVLPGKHARGRRGHPDRPRWEAGSRSQGHGESPWRSCRAPSRVEDSGVRRSGDGRRTARKPMDHWQTSRWPPMARTVLTRQKRLDRAAQRGDDRPVRRRQKRLLRSHDAKRRAVRHVTQDNRGKKTPGGDGMAALTPAERRTLAEHLPRDGNAAPVRRVDMPQPGTLPPQGLGNQRPGSTRWRDRHEPLPG